MRTERAKPTTTGRGMVDVAQPWCAFCGKAIRYGEPLFATRIAPPMAAQFAHWGCKAGVEGIVCAHHRDKFLTDCIEQERSDAAAWSS